MDTHFSSVEIIACLKQNLLFENVYIPDDLKEQEQLIQKISIIKVKTGGIIINQGDKGDSLFLLLKGKASVFVCVENDTIFEVATLAENIFFGEMAIIDEAKRMASIKAITNCVLCEISKDDFWQYFNNLKNISRNLIKVVSGRLRTTSHSLFDRLQSERKELIRFNIELEKQVKEKTVDLEKSQERLIQSEKMASLGQLVAGVAHEINTPVGIGVTVSSHLIKRTAKIMDVYKNKKMSKADLEKYFENTLEIGELIFEHLTQTANLVKTFKMISVDQFVHENRVFNVKSYLKNIIKSLGPELKKKGHVVQLICVDDLEIDNYPGVLSQVVINLVMNSIIHAYDENEKGIIKIDACQKKDEIIIKYRDDGKGMSKDILNKIFDPFFTTKRGAGGSGLGMHIVYNSITQILMGKIECESTPGKGTGFTIHIPIKINKATTGNKKG